MKGRLPAVLALVVTVLAADATPPPVPPPSSVWEGRAFLRSFAAGCCIDETGSLHGVLRVSGLFGPDDVYHFTGTWNRQTGTFEGRHHSGHRASGRLISAAEAAVTLTTRHGREVSVRAVRLPNISAGADCDPVR